MANKDEKTPRIGLFKRFRNFFSNLFRWSSKPKTIETTKGKGFVISHFLEKPPNKTEKPTKLRFLTLNIACLPKVFGRYLNGSFLRPNLERVREITQKILEVDQPDVISFQEAFDKDAQALLIKELLSTYPYVLHNVGNKTLNAGSGLMIFSKLPILDAQFHRYTNTMIGEETLANKGFLGCKIQLDESKFFTVYNTHTQAGGAILKKLQSKIGGTTSARRGEEFGQIAQHIDRWASTPPSNQSHLQHLTTHLTGDLNTGLNDGRSMLSISTGQSANNFKPGQTKYDGQKHLFEKLQKTVPENFLDARGAKLKGTKKLMDATKLDKAEKNKHFTGTACNQKELKEKIKGRHSMSFHAGRKILDAMDIVTPKTPIEGFKSKIVSFGNATDHAGVVGELKLTP